MRNAWWLVVLVAGCVDPVEPQERAAVERVPVELEGVSPNPGELRFFLFTPSSPRPGAGLVVALHGCAQTAADYQRVGWHAVAQTHGFYVLSVQAPSASGCFRWFEPAHARRGQGEAASVVAGVDWVLARYGVDRRRVFVTGLSAGAAMSAALLAVAPDVFSAGAIFAGVGPGCATIAAEGVRCMGGVDLTPAQWAARARALGPLTNGAPPRVQVWTGADDTTVSPTMARELVEQWTALHGLDDVAEEREAFDHLTSEVHGTNQVQLVSLAQFGHAVPVFTAQGCGSVGAFVREGGVCGALEAARFFGLLDAVAPTPVEPAPPATRPDGGTAATEDAGAALDAGLPVAAADGGLALARCREALASPTWHVWLRRAEVCGFFGTLACAVGSHELLGSTLSSVPVVAWSEDGAVWHAGVCP